MAKESRYPVERQCIFRETFNDEASVRANGGVPTGLIFNNGVGVFDGSTSKIQYRFANSAKYTSFSVRLKGKINWAAALKYILNNAENTFRLYTNSGATAQSPTGLVYINGVYAGITGSPSSLVSNDVVITFTDSIIKISNFTLGSTWSGSIGPAMELELFEIYSGTLSAQDVANLYNNKRQKPLKLDKDEQLGSELIVNGSFSTDTDWTKSAANWTISGGTANYDYTGGSTYISPTVPVPLTSGKRYRVTFTLSYVGSGKVMRCFLSSSTGTVFNDYWSPGYVNFTSPGTYSITILVTNTVTNFRFYGNIDSTIAWSLDNLSIKEIVVERTRNILDVCACKGGIFNKLSGNPYVELVTNGGFDSDTSWFKDAAWTIANGTANCDGTGSSSAIYQLVLTAGKSYQLSFQIKNYVSGSVSVYCGYPTLAATLSANGTYVYTGLIGGATNNRVSFISNSFVGSIDNVSVKEIIPPVVNTAMTVSKQGDTNVMQFSGTTSRVDCGSYDTLVGDKTFIAWVDLGKLAGSGGDRRILDNSKIVLYSNIPSKSINITSDGISTVASYTISSDFYEKYHLVVITRTSIGIVNLYWDGAINGTPNQSSGTPVAGTTNILIGNNSASIRNFYKYLNQVRIIDGILTATEISQLYSQEKSKYGL